MYALKIQQSIASAENFFTVQNFKYTLLILATNIENATTTSKCK